MVEFCFLVLQRYKYLERHNYFGKLVIYDNISITSLLQARVLLV